MQEHWGVSFKGKNTSNAYIRLCVHLSPNTVNTHIHGHVLRRGMCVFLWQQSEIWRVTAVLSCINYKKAMNQRQGKSVSLQESVCSLGTVPPSLLHDKHVSVYARASIFLMFVHKCLCKLQVPSICAMRHWAVTKKKEMRQEYNQSNYHSFIKPIRWPDEIWLCQ